jgi:anaerobic selenocysteine-containing dehydrogenase/Fe-S-cluster-containing dehydrogenase component
MADGIRRRDFFKALAAGGATTAAVAACADKPEKLIPYLLPPDNVEFVPGMPMEYATTCMECPANCGMVVRTREARAIKAEGNPDHPISQGALCVRGQASLQTHYNPARLAEALQRKGDALQPVAWDAAEQAFADAIRALADRRQIVYLTGNAAGTRGGFLDRWLSAVGASPKLVLDPLAHHNIKAANQLTFRRAEVPQYRMDAATLLVNFGAEFLEVWQNPVENNRLYTAMHAYDDATKRKGRFVHVGPHLSLTGSNADKWVKVNPGSEVVLVLAMAREVLARTRGRSVGTDRERLAAYLEPYTLERAATDTGAEAAALHTLAEDFAKADPGLALAGGNAAATTEGTQLQVAVNLLNYAAGNVGRTVLFGASRQIDLSSSHADVLAAVKRMQAGEVKLLIVDGANPLYHLPPSAQVAGALEKVPMIVSLSSAMDETTARAHLVLPGQSAFERWGDAFPQRGVYSLQQPVMASIYPVKAAEDTLLAVAAKLGVNAFGESKTYRDVLRASWQQVQREVGAAGDFEEFWRTSLQKGGAFRTVSFSSSVRLNPEALSGSPGVAKLAGEGMALIPTVSLRHRDGRGASNPWLQEIADPISQVVWDSWADINPATAKKMGIAHGELIKVTSPQGELELAAYLHYGIHEDAIAIPIGQGHTHSGRNADQVGVNVLALLPSAVDRQSGEFAYLTTRVQVKGSGRQAYLVQTDGSPRQLGREVIQTQTLAEAVAGKAPELREEVLTEGVLRHPWVDFYPLREEQTAGYHHPYRWGMTVDVDRCTGCTACVAACYAENNLAVVGKERMGLGREMAWITVQRFLEGRGDDYKTLVQPMMCQHCGNAGCEPVCPVYATYHNPEGLNAQIYNRCVGTRYCSNNCPYKVRRFNWFNYEWESPLHLQLNPDVTVRSKGVMEKCTFCVQRINRARQAANAQGRNIGEGEVTPACVQTCPTKALTFGNLSDPNSAVARKSMRERKELEQRVRQYEVFPELKQHPAITYLRKVTFEPTHQEA